MPSGGITFKICQCLRLEGLQNKARKIEIIDFLIEKYSSFYFSVIYRETVRIFALLHAMKIFYFAVFPLSKHIFALSIILPRRRAFHIAQPEMLSACRALNFSTTLSDYSIVIGREKYFLRCWKAFSSLVIFEWRGRELLRRLMSPLPSLFITREKEHFVRCRLKIATAIKLQSSR